MYDRQYKLYQNYFKVKQEAFPSQLIHIPHWEFKLYALLVEEMTRQGKRFNQWAVRPENLDQILGTSGTSLFRALAGLKRRKLIDTRNGTIVRVQSNTPTISVVYSQGEN